VNPFSNRTAAAGYVRGRPFFHPKVVRHVRERLDLSAPLPSALDVGCGTGLSSLALRAIAGHVAGVDASADMVAAAIGEPGIAYAVASAEQLPARDAAFHLVTASQVIHWVDWSRFTGEVRRVLRPGGWLVVYDHFIAVDAEHAGSPLQRWWQAEYLPRFPSVPQKPVPWNDAEAWRAAGFGLLHHDRFTNAVSFTPAGFVDYLVTLSSVVAAVEGGRETLGSARDWLLGSTAHLFGGAAEASFPFWGPITILRRA
jgi:SAM-dependent methyltransferase